MKNRWQSREEYYGWKPYVRVADRRADAAKEMERRKKRGLPVEPLGEVPRKIAVTFWGRTWCESLAKQADFANRLPRGQTYVRNGSVVHLAIGRGDVKAVVSGSELYDVTIGVKPITDAHWKKLKDACAGKVGSALELLQGKLSDQVMTVLTQPGDGMIPKAGEFTMRCSCPDSARMCKHVAAVLYGVGARLDQRPELLFTLRGVEMKELVTEASKAVTKGRKPTQAIEASDSALADIFGIDMGGSVTAKVAKAAKVAKVAEPAQELTAAEVRALGYTAGQMKKMVEAGTLERTGYGWYRFTGRAST